MKNSITIIVLLLLVASCHSRSTIRQKVLDYDFSGIVVKSYRDIKNHALPIIILNNNNKIMHCSISLYNSAKPGDSINKNKGELYYTIIRNDSVMKFYADVNNVEIRE